MQESVWTIDNREIQITHPDKLYWPAFSKLQTLTYYKDISPLLLPYCLKRPVTIHFAPDGISGGSFYVRDRQPSTPEWIPSISYHLITENKISQLMAINSIADIIYFVDKGGLEFHVWNALQDNLRKPDQIIIDLDISPQTKFSHICEAASIIHTHLKKEYDLECFAKTTGMKGMHIYIPIKREYSFTDVEPWIAQVAEDLCNKNPQLLALPHKNKTHVGAKVILDIHQNSMGKNTAAPYSLRLNPEGPCISTPVSWDEIQQENIQPLDFTPDVILKRVKKMGDIFSQTLTLHQTIRN